MDSTIQHQYTLVEVTGAKDNWLHGVSPCASHRDIPIEHLFGNTNWTMERIEKTVKFTCQQCGEVRTYLQVAEKTLL